MYIFYLYVQTIIHQCFCFPNSQWGVTAHDITIPYICCFVRGTYHPIHFQWGINPSHFLAAFHCTLHLPLLWSVSIHMGHLSILFHHLILSLHSWGTYPSHRHFCSTNISHFWHTWSLTLFFWLPLNSFWSILYNLSFFSLNFPGFYLFFHWIMSF